MNLRMTPSKCRFYIQLCIWRIDYSLITQPKLHRELASPRLLALAETRV